MATLNVSIVDSDGVDTAVLDEALCALRWAAEAGPFSLDVKSPGDAGPVDALLLARPLTEAAQRGLHRDLGTYAALRAVAGEAGWLFLRPAGPRLGSVRQLVETAADLARRRRGRVAVVDGGGVQDGSRPDVEISHLRPETFRSAVSDAPDRFDVVVLADDEAHHAAAEAEASLGATAFASTAWLGHRGQMYAAYAEDDHARPEGAAVRAVAEAVQSVALLLECTAARHGLAQTLRHSLSLALRDVTGAPERSIDRGAGHMGQAVFDRLEERFPLCVSW